MNSPVPHHPIDLAPIQAMLRASSLPRNKAPGQPTTAWSTNSRK